MLSPIVKLVPVLVLSAFVALGACSNGDECATLSSCCSSTYLVASQQAGCKTVATANVASDCASALDTLEMSGFCGGKASGGSSSGSATSTSGSSSSECRALMSCCNQLPANDQANDLQTCNQTLSMGSAFDCATTLASFQMSGMCQ